MTRTPIDPADIRKGDKVAAVSHGMETTFTVDHVDGGRFYASPDNADHASEAFLWGDGNEWFLLDRPAPAVDLPTVPTLGLLTFYAGEESSGLGVHRSRLGIFRRLDSVVGDGLTDDAGAGMWPTSSIVAFEPMTAVPTSALDEFRHVFENTADTLSEQLAAGDRFLAAVDAANGTAS